MNLRGILSIPLFSRLGVWLRRGPGRPIDVSLQGRTVVVTGATGGLGRAAADRLAELGADVVVVGRSAEKVAAVVGDLGAAATGEVADLSLMSEVRRLAGRLLAAHDRIHVLINNVGSLFPERSETEEGIERTLATNLLGQFLLTELLIPRLRESAPARIVTVASGGMYGQALRVGDLESAQGGYKGAAAYARTKRGQVELTEHWADRLRGTGVVAHAMHPGWVDTPGVRTSLPRFRRVLGPLLRSPEQGADTIVWLAAAPEPAESSGRFWHDRRPQPTHLVSRTRTGQAEQAELVTRLAALAQL